MLLLFSLLRLLLLWTLLSLLLRCVYRQTGAKATPAEFKNCKSTSARPLGTSGMPFSWKRHAAQGKHRSRVQPGRSVLDIRAKHQHRVAMLRSGRWYLEVPPRRNRPCEEKPMDNHANGYVLQPKNTKPPAGTSIFFTENNHNALFPVGAPGSKL